MIELKALTIFGRHNLPLAEGRFYDEGPVGMDEFNAFFHRVCTALVFHLTILTNKGAAVAAEPVSLFVGFLEGLKASKVLFADQGLSRAGFQMEDFLPAVFAVVKHIHTSFSFL